LADRADGNGSSRRIKASAMMTSHPDRSGLSALAPGQARRPRPWPKRCVTEAPGSAGRKRRLSRGRWGATGWLRRKCRLAAARIRTSSGVTEVALEREFRAGQSTPWLGLLLWALACAGLFVSLLMDAGGPDREQRLAARSRDAQHLIARPAFHVTDEGSGRSMRKFSLPR
jgi:hypothetical protein